MREHKQSRIILSLLLGLLLLALCLPVCAFAEPSELSDGDEAGISLSTIVPPNVISGAGAAYTNGGATGLTFTTDDVKGNLSRVLVDGKVVSPENYTVSGEPLAITLHPGFLDTLSAGEHTIEIFTTNGSAAARFTIKAKSGGGPGTDPGSPRTGDDHKMGLWIVLMVLSGTGLLSLFQLGKRRRNQQKT